MDQDRVPELVGSALRERLGGFTRGVSLTERIKSMDIRRENMVSVELDAAITDDDELAV